MVQVYSVHISGLIWHQQPDILFFNALNWVILDASQSATRPTEEIMFLRSETLELPDEAKKQLHATFFAWWYPSLLLLNDSLRLFRHFGDDDFTSLCLCATQYGLREIATRHPVNPVLEGVDFRDVDASNLRPISLFTYARTTGIPNETARRKVSAAPSHVPIVLSDRSGMQLQRFPAELDVLAQFALALARALLGCLRIPIGEAKDVRGLEQRAALLSSFIELVLTQLKARRTQTRHVSAISVQTALSIGIAKSVFDFFSRRGEGLQIDLRSFGESLLMLEEEKYPIYFSLLEDLTGLPRRLVHTTCERLQEAGVLQSVDRYRVVPILRREAILVGPAGHPFSEDVRRAGNLFVTEAIKALTSTPTAKQNDQQPMA